jgi:hypothetical protein
MKRLFFDCETSPNIVYSWRVGYKIDLSHDNIIEERRIICISYKWEGSEDVKTLTWDKNNCDAALLRKFTKLAANADELVGHNGDRFDIKWFRTRCLVHGIEAKPHYTSVDTLKLAKSGFYFNSNRLDYLGSLLTGKGKKETGGFGLWKGVMNGDRKALKEMVDYCEQDVLLLEKVFHKLQPYSKHKTHVGALAGGYKHHCPTCGSEDTKRNKSMVTAAGTPQIQMVCNQCLRATGKRTYWTLAETTYWKSTSDERKAKGYMK